MKELKYLRGIPFALESTHVLTVAYIPFSKCSDFGSFDKGKTGIEYRRALHMRVLNTTEGGLELLLDGGDIAAYFNCKLWVYDSVQPITRVRAYQSLLRAGVTPSGSR